MNDWPRLTQDEQRELLAVIAVTLLESAPSDWQRIVLEHRQLGGHIEISVGLISEDGALRAWTPPQRVWHRFQDLRAGAREPDRGTWFTARYTLERPDRFDVHYEWTAEPEFREPPTARDYREDREEFPRGPEHTPAWFRDRLREAVGDPGHKACL
ncbi:MULTISPECIES: hypothetical protein [Actinosynnema]|uniref:Uncharacterized protein n=1 Tax=Actinosynnema pretiosum TaxID=42197 RepID=A0A290Z5X3_9PSEU|nr:hypothetical protein [Actinosynnema pretiosum]ATE54420.1 hypothetical protein CNX65_14895 [Actinosynnema pretiosum]